MSKEKGILTREVEKKIAIQLASKISIFKPTDRLMFRIVISTLDDKFAEKIPEDYKLVIREAISKIYMEKDYEKAIHMAMAFADNQIDLPWLDDPDEAMLFHGFAEILVGIVAKLHTPKEEK